MNVTVYTRHCADCPKKSDKYWKRCKCPKWLSTSDDRGFTRQSAKTRSWEKAESIAKTMEQQPPKRADRASHALDSSKRKSIESAVEKFLKNKKADGVDEGTYYNPGFGHTQAVPRVGQEQVSGVPRRDHTRRP
jgi:hypothetical protein